MQLQRLSHPHLAGLVDTQSCKIFDAAPSSDLQQPLSLARAGSVVDLAPSRQQWLCLLRPIEANPLPQNLRLWPAGRPKGSKSSEASGQNAHGIYSTLHLSVSSGGLLLRVLPSYAINLKAGAKKKALPSSYTLCQLTTSDFTCAAGSNQSGESHIPHVGPKRG